MNQEGQTESAGINRHRVGDERALHKRRTMEKGTDLFFIIFLAIQNRVVSLQSVAICILSAYLSV